MAPNSTIVVLLNIGHKACHLTSPKGDFTHDWSAYVVGADGIDIHHFVERVVFKLHETFENPVQVRTEPPYMIHEQGYASFALKLEIVFKNSDKPNLIEYEYDLVLPGEGQPPVKYFRQEKLIFRNTPDDFRQKLLKGGAMETDPQAKEELARKKAAENAAKSSGPDPKISDDDKSKKKKDKDKVPKHKKNKDKDKGINMLDMKSSGVFGIPKPGGANSNSQNTKGTMSQSDSSSSSSSSSESPSNSPMAKTHLNSSGKHPTDSSSSSNDENEDDNNGHINQSVGSKMNSNTSKRGGQSTNHSISGKKFKGDKDMKKNERSVVSLKKAPNGMPLDALVGLHDRIKELKDPDMLQRFVDVIEETGQYKITETSFDFDLCILDETAIHKLEALFK